MNYCEECKVVFQEDKCPVCGSRHVREVMPDDPCFLVEKEQIWASVLSEVLDDNGIPFFCKNVLGAGMAIKTGPMRERVRFYVKKCDIPKANDIVEELFSAGDDEITDEE